MRKTEAGADDNVDERARILADEFRDDALGDCFSVYRADDAEELRRIAVLYAALRSLPKSFKYVVIAPELLPAFDAEALAVVDPDGFHFLQSRHYELSGIRDVDRFARTVAGTLGTFGKKPLKRAVEEERAQLAYSTAAEWAVAPKWP